MGPRDALARIIYTAAGLGLTGGPALAGDSEFGAHAGARIGYSDNVTLAPAGSELDQRITELDGGFTFSRSQERLDAYVAYLLEGVFYPGASDSNQVYNTLDASSRLAMIRDVFYLDTFAVYDQTVKDSAGAYSFNKLAITGNLTDMLSIGVSPYVLLEIGSNVTGLARVSFSKLDYDEPTLDDSSEKFAMFNLGNSKARSGGSWGVSYNKELYDYEHSPDVDFESLAVDLGFWVVPTLRLFTTQGLESDYTLVLEQPGKAAPGLDTHYWYVGAEWRPSDRNILTVTTGERSFGHAESFNWAYKAAKGGIGLNYSEEPATYVREHLRSTRTTGELSPIDSLDGPEGNPFFLQKSWALTFTLDRPRTGAGLRFFDERRYDIVEATVNGQPGGVVEKYTGLELDGSWKINTAASINVAVQRAERTSVLSQLDDTIDYAYVEWARRVGRQNQLNLRFARESSEPGAGAIGRAAYVENQVTIGISRWFAADTTSGVSKRFNGYLNNSASGYAPPGSAGTGNPAPGNATPRP
jgi:hypothetical protein